MVALAALGHWPAASLPLMLPLGAGGFAGALAGQRLAPLLPDRQLRRGFAALLIGSALLSGAEAWRRQEPSRPPANSKASSTASQQLPAKRSAPSWQSLDPIHHPQP